MEMGTAIILGITETGTMAEIITGVGMTMEAGMAMVGEIMAKVMEMEAVMTTETGATAGIILSS